MPMCPSGGVLYSSILQNIRDLYLGEAMDVQIVGVGLRMVLSVWAAVTKVVWVLML